MRDGLAGESHAGEPMAPIFAPSTRLPKKAETMQATMANITRADILALGAGSGSERALRVAVVAARCSSTSDCQTGESDEAAPVVR